jgi:hypothetical protein
LTKDKNVLYSLIEAGKNFLGGKAAGIKNFQGHWSLPISQDKKWCNFNE